MSATTPAQEMDIVERLEAEADAWDQTEDDFYGPLLREAKAEIERLRDARAAVIEECAAHEDEFYKIICDAREGFYRDGPATHLGDIWQRKGARKIVAFIRALANRSALPREDQR